MVWIGLIWLRIGIRWGLLWTRKWTFGFHIMLGISWVAAQLAPSQEGLSSMNEWWLKKDTLHWWCVEYLELCISQYSLWISIINSRSRNSLESFFFWGGATGQLFNSVSIFIRYTVHGMRHCRSRTFPFYYRLICSSVWVIWVVPFWFETFSLYWIIADICDNIFMNHRTIDWYFTNLTTLFELQVLKLSM
jgi:hypothetical protein